MEVNHEKMLESAVSTRRGVILFSIIALIVGTLLAFVISKGIIGPLKMGVSLAESISNGDLTQRTSLKLLNIRNEDALFRWIQ